VQQGPFEGLTEPLKNLPLVGPIVSGLGQRVDGFLGMGPDATQALQEQYQRNLALLKGYRPRAMAAREQGLAHTLGAYGPANEYLKQMYGEQFGLDLNALGNPGIAEYLTDPSVLQQAEDALGEQQKPTETGIPGVYIGPENESGKKPILGADGQGLTYTQLLRLKQQAGR